MVEIERKYLVHKTVFKYIDTRYACTYYSSISGNEKSKSVRGELSMIGLFDHKERTEFNEMNMNKKSPLMSFVIDRRF